MIMTESAEPARPPAGAAEAPDGAHAPTVAAYSWRTAPRAVRAVTVLAWVAGMLSILVGLFVLWVAALPTDELVRDDILVLGMFEITIGLALVLAASALPAMRRWSRIVVTVVAALIVVHTVLGAIVGLPLAWVPTALCTLLIVLLWAGPARRRFRAPRVGAYGAGGPSPRR